VTGQRLPQGRPKDAPRTPGPHRVAATHHVAAITLDAVGLDRRLSRALRDLDEYELRRLIIYARGRLAGSEGPDFRKDDSPHMTYRQELVRCNKPGCTRCPHGPYWYAYWREGGRVKSHYVGKTLPEGVVVPGMADTT
jgi:hypothetical protein